MDNMLYRKQLKSLQGWFLSEKRKPLVLRGARQVGKTTLVRELCLKLKIQIVEINLELDSELRSTFTLLDPNKIMERISVLKQNIPFGKYLLFIDEIQVVPEALQCLRYFYEKRPDIAVIAAGSLLEFVMRDHQFSMPVGRVEYLFIGPMQFSEFLHAMGERKLFEIFQQFNFVRSLDPIYHEKLMDLYFDFLHVGGMPEAVNDFSKSRDFNAAIKCQRTIILNYRNDFPKYSKQKPYPIRLEKVFDYIPSHIGQKVKYSEISEGEQSRDLKMAIDLLAMSNVAHKVLHSNASGIPLKMGEKEKIFKLLFIDTGLVSYMLKLDPVSIKNLYLKPNDNVHLLYRGLISEQFVGQNLLYANEHEPPELYYWLRDERSNKAEVDYLIQIGTQIIPIEVKAGRTGSIKSLVQFIKEKKSKLAVKMGAKPPQIESNSIEGVQLQRIELPLYFAERLYSILTPLIK